MNAPPVVPNFLRRSAADDLESLPKRNRSSQNNSSQPNHRPGSQTLDNNHFIDAGMSEGPKKKAEKKFGRPGNPMNIKQIFRSQRSIGYGIAMLVVAIFPMQAFGQNSVLKTRYLRSTFADRIDVAHGNKKPKKVIFLEVIGDFNLRDPERNSIPLTDISLILSTTIDGKLTTQQFEPRGVGLGNGLGRRYVLADEFSSGERHGRSESGECLLKKEKNGKPAVLVVIKDPSQLIFVFDIPKEPEAKYALKIGDTKFVIQRPPSNEN